MSPAAFAWPTHIPDWQRSVCRLLLRRDLLLRPLETADPRLPTAKRRSWLASLHVMPGDAKHELSPGLLLLAASLLEHHRPGSLKVPLPLRMLSRPLASLCAAEALCGEIQDALELVEIMNSAGILPPVGGVSTVAFNPAPAQIAWAISALEDFFDTSAAPHLLRVSLYDAPGMTC